jgi:hypothetical protein
MTTNKLFGASLIAVSLALMGCEDPSKKTKEAAPKTGERTEQTVSTPSEGAKQAGDQQHQSTEEVRGKTADALSEPKHDAPKVEEQHPFAPTTGQEHTSPTPVPGITPPSSTQGTPPPSALGISSGPTQEHTSPTPVPGVTPPSSPSPSTHGMPSTMGTAPVHQPTNPGGH